MVGSIRLFLVRLHRNTAANTLAIVAAALVPLAAMVGSAVDLSRAYMARSKLQSACDAASLAARRVMKYDSLSEEVIDTGTEYFAFNFPGGMYGASDFAPEITRPEPGVIRVEAETQVPTVVMQMFGYATLPVSTSCDASLNFVNTDVVLVLDVTGSMADNLDGSPKIAALREAVMALYDELEPVQEQLQSQGLRLRYGIVPYSSSVKVGRLLYDVNPDYIRNTVTFPSRVANYTTPTHIANAPTASGAWEYYNGSSGSGSGSPGSATLTSSQCQSWVGAASTSGGGPAPTPTTQMSYGGTSSSSAYVQSQDWGWAGAPSTSGTYRSCRRWKTTTTTTYTTKRTFTNWTYRDESYNLSAFKKPGGSITLALNGGSNVADPGGSYNAQQLASVALGAPTTVATWNGCIEERDTVTTINGGTSLTIPNAAYDLDINRLPSSDATRWRPMLPEVVYSRTAGSTSTTSNAGSASNTGWIRNYEESKGYYACPSEARRLAEWERTDLETYVSSLKTVGGTYHDIGMLWGARLISTGGVFADGCDTYNAMPCNRHIIFMTDGAQTAYCNVLSAYGLEQNAMRVTGAGSCPEQLARHKQRFRMVCNAAKNLNVSVWVIGFDTALDSDLTGCASNIAQATTSADGESLIARFRQIGNQIGALRLTR